MGDQVIEFVHTKLLLGTTTFYWMPPLFNLDKILSILSAEVSFSPAINL